MQQLADWIEKELVENQEPRVKFLLIGGAVYSVERNVTYLSYFGALVQMFDPIKIMDPSRLTHGLYTVPNSMLEQRVMRILGIDNIEYLSLLRYLHSKGGSPYRVIEAIRTLK